MNKSMFKQKYSLSVFRRYKWVYFMFIPALVFAILFNYIPIAGLQLAFKDYRPVDGIWGSQIVGLKYFVRMFNEATFLNVFKNTLIISFFKIIFVFPAGIIFALLLNELAAKRSKRVYQTISYLPYFLSWIVVASIMRELLALDGPLNAVRAALNLPPELLLTSKSAFVPLLIISELWKDFGYNSIIYLAAITSVSSELYEAAALDGAGRLRCMWSVTLPGIAPVIFMMFILRIGGILNAGFDQIFNLYSPVVYSVADILDTYVYRIGLMDMNFSYSTAVGLFKNVIGFSLVLLTNAASKRNNEMGL